MVTGARLASQGAAWPTAPAALWLELTDIRVRLAKGLRRTVRDYSKAAIFDLGGGVTRKITGKSGRPLGNKGTETRSSLMAATRELLDTSSPLSLTAAAIAKKAGTAAATFYVYFDDVEDILWAMCDSVTQDTTDLFANDTLLRDEARLEDDAVELVRAYGEIWSRHAPILLFRNLESDRGNARFNRLLTRTGLPILQGLIDRIIESCAPDKIISRSDANAEAVVILAAMDRLAAAIHLYPEESLMPEILVRAQARIIARTLRRR